LPRTPSTTLSIARYLFWSGWLPVSTLVFLLTGPHEWWVALLWVMPVVVLTLLDGFAPRNLHAPRTEGATWPYEVVLWLLAGLQILNHVLLGVLASRLTAGNWPETLVMLANLFAVVHLGSATAANSGIVLAHEFIHRRGRWHRLMGRIQLIFVCYDHFATEHVRGHHARVATLDDPATARHGESFLAYYKRSVPAQFKSAWKLENKRLGDENMRWQDRRMLSHKVLHGVLAEIALGAAFWYFAGPIGLLFFAAQARTAVILLELINYVEHWGLLRNTRKVMPCDSWDSDSHITLHSLVGLARHADHHANATRPYHQLRVFHEAPRMPSGYYATLMLAMLFNRKYQELADAELRRRGLGPYRPQTAEPEVALAA